MTSHFDGTQLRPMGVGDIADASIRLYRRHYLTFTSVMAAFAVAQAGSSVANHFFLTSSSGGRTPSAEQLVTQILVSPLISFALMIIAFFAMGTVARIVSDAITGRPIHAGAAARQVLSRVRSQIWAAILIGLAFMGLCVTIIGIPFALYFYIGWLLVTPAIVLEGLGGRAAMRRSSQLVRGNRLRVIGLAILVWVIASILSLGPAALVGAATAGNPLLVFTPAAQTGTSLVGLVLVQAITTTLFGALSMIAFTLLYFDLRVREEGFDLELRATHEEPRTLAAAA